MDVVVNMLYVRPSSPHLSRNYFDVEFAPAACWELVDCRGLAAWSPYRRQPRTRNLMLQVQIIAGKKCLNLS
jgi:hypothetical protein